MILTRELITFSGFSQIQEKLQLSLKSYHFFRTFIELIFFLSLFFLIITSYFLLIRAFVGFARNSGQQEFKSGYEMHDLRIFLSLDFPRQTQSV